MQIDSGLFRIDMTISDVLYINYMLPTERVRPFVPWTLSLSTVEGMAMVSVVLFDCRGVQAAFSPWPRFNYSQLNIRTYVVDPPDGKQAVFFLHSVVTSHWVSFLTCVLGVPWRQIALDIDFEDKDQPSRASYSARGRWGKDFRIQAVPDGDLTGKLTPFESTDAAIDYLIMPQIGYYENGGSLGRFVTRHPRVWPQCFKIEEIRLPFLRELRILEEDEVSHPHSTLFVSMAEFNVYLPPVWAKIGEKK